MWFRNNNEFGSLQLRGTTDSYCTVQFISTKNYLVPNVHSDEYEEYWITEIYRSIIDGKTEK